MTAVGWSGDATYIAVGDANGNIALLNDTTCSCWDFRQSFHAHNGQINAIVWSQGQKTFATASDDGTVQTWSGAGGQHKKTYTPGGQVYTVAWSPDGKHLLSGNSNNQVQIWDA